MTPVPEPKLIDALRRLYREHDNARALLDVMAERKQDRYETSVERAANLAGLTPEAAAEVLRELERAGAGKMRLGRHGYKTRIEWQYNQRSLGEVARGQAAHPEAVNTTGAKETKVGEMELVPEGTTLLKHQFRLRPDLTIDFDLPSDFTDKDAERLANYLRSVPF